MSTRFINSDLAVPGMAASFHRPRDVIRVEPPGSNPKPLGTKNGRQIEQTVLKAVQSCRPARTRHIVTPSSPSRLVLPIQSTTASRLRPNKGRTAVDFHPDKNSESQQSGSRSTLLKSSRPCATTPWASTQSKRSSEAS